MTQKISGDGIQQIGEGLDRRVFVKYLLTGTAAGTLLGSTVFLSGCPAIDAVGTWLPIGIDAFNSVLALLDPPLEVIVAPISALIKTGFADLVAAVDDYESAPAADKATLLDRIKTLLSKLAENFQSFLTQLAGTPGYGIVAGLVQIILDAIAGLAGRLGLAAAFPKQLKMAKPGFAGSVMTITPLNLNKKQFIKLFNTKLDDVNHPEQHIPHQK